MSFHVIKGFRNLRRDQVLVAVSENNRVLRFEANLTTRLAPLGTFTNELDNLARPLGIAQGPDGDVYISEQIADGRVLRFSSTGVPLKSVVRYCKEKDEGVQEGTILSSHTQGAHQWTWTPS